MIDYRLRDPFVLDHAGMIGTTTKWKLNEVWFGRRHPRPHGQGSLSPEPGTRATPILLEQFLICRKDERSEGTR
jgi:hypothetical protein